MKPTNSQPDPRIQKVLSLHQAGKLTEAAEGLRELIRVFPSDPRFQAHLGTILLQLGKAGEALTAFDQVLVFKSDWPQAFANRALALQTLGRLDEALRSYDQAIASKPEAWLYFNRANVLRDLGRLEEAVESYGECLRLNPKQVEALNNRGALLLSLRRPLEALDDFNQTTTLRPDDPEGFNNRGNLLRGLGRPEEALADYDRAIALKPAHADSWNNRGVALQELGRRPEAMEAYDKAIALQNDFAFAYWNKSQLELLMGQWEEGWKLYEWRWKSAMKKEARNFVKPLWLGDPPLTGKTILIWAEQGMGDIMQYARYVPMVETLGAQVVFEAPRPLVLLLRTLPGRALVVSSESSLPDFDLQCPLISLPLAFKTTLATVPASVPYLSADPVKVAAWAEKLGPKKTPRIGLAWSGRAEHSNDHNRSVALKTLEPLLKLPFEFHSLQKEMRETDAAWLQQSGLIGDHRDALGDFSDTAALVANLDLVITVDSSAAHLSGALGKPIWVLIPFAPDHRWLLGRDDNPWYPQAVLFRQTVLGDWESVVSRLAERLQDRFKSQRSSH